MEYLHKIRTSVAATAHSVAAQVNLALPGNPIFREFQVGEQIGSSGPGLCWKIYAGTKNSTKQEVAIWLFEKKQTENWLKVRREELPEMLKRGVGQLTRLRHPRILTVERALEESRDSFAFCTEPIFASLANCFGDVDNIPQPRHLKDFTLHDLEIRHGLFQVAEALAFLHNDIKMVHGNVSPYSILINSKGAWKLGGFDFCIIGNTSVPGKLTFDLPTWSRDSVSALCPGLDYVAPEMAEGTKCDTLADIFSLGALAFATFNKGKPLFDSQNSFACYSKHFERLKQSISTLLLIVPAEIREDVLEPDSRAEAGCHSIYKGILYLFPFLHYTAHQLPFFEHPLVKTLNFLDSRSAMDNTQKMQFFKGLPAVLPQFPLRVQIQKVYPHLAAEYATPMLIPFLLGSVFLIAEKASAEQFSSTIMPSLVSVFPIQTPYQIGLLLLQRIGLFLDKMPASAIKQHLIPLIYNSLSSDSLKIQELCLAEVPNVSKYVDREQMRTQLLPKLLRMVLESKEVNIRVQTMVCLAKLLPQMEPWMVADQLLPSLAKVNSKDPAVLMAVLGIYKMVSESEKFGINKEQCAKNVLPFLISTSIESTLNLQQFDQFMSLVHKLLEKVECEQRKSLLQLTASQEEQKKITDFADFLNGRTEEMKPNGETEVVDLTNLTSMLGGLSKDGPVIANTNSPFVYNSTAANSNFGLTLEDKKRIVAEKEGQKNQPGGRAADQSSSQRSTQLSGPAVHVPFDLFSSPSKQPDQRPTNSHEKSQPNQLDFLSEFLPTSRSSSTTPALPGPSQLTQSASFAAFPSIPLPNTSSNPIQRRTGQHPAGDKDPFDSLLTETNRTDSARQEGIVTANFFSQLNKERPVGNGNKDLFEDLLS